MNDSKHSNEQSLLLGLKHKHKRKYSQKDHLYRPKGKHFYLSLKRKTIKATQALISNMITRSEMTE